LKNIDKPSPKRPDTSSKTTSLNTDKTPSQGQSNNQSHLKGIRPNQPTNPPQRWTSQPTRHGFNSAYLALTFSTLLSSQNSGTHRTSASLHPLGATRLTLCDC
jgi:hypothetical protein